MYKKVSQVNNNQALVVEKLDSAIHQVNHYPVDKCYENQSRFPLERDLFKGWCYPPFEQLGPGGQFVPFIDKGGNSLQFWVHLFHPGHKYMYMVVYPPQVEATFTAALYRTQFCANSPVLFVVYLSLLLMQSFHFLLSLRWFPRYCYLSFQYNLFQTIKVYTQS